MDAPSNWSSPTGESPIRANVQVLDVFYKQDKRWLASRTKAELAAFVPSPSHPEPGMRLAIKFRSGDPNQQHLWEKEEYYDYLVPSVDDEGMRQVDDPHSAVGNMARARWAVFGPHFEAFLSKTKLEVTGTVLEHWLTEPGDATRLAMLKSCGLRTVEEFLRAPESLMIALAPRMPDVRRYRELAVTFMRVREKSDHQKAIEAVASEKDGEISSLKEQIAEMRGMMEALLQAQIEQAKAAGGEADEPPKRRGRPPKIEADAETAEAA